MKKQILYIAFALLPLLGWSQIDRSKVPEAGPEPTINLTEPQTFELKNGLKVLVVENNKLPRVTIQLSLDNAPIVEGDKAGVSSLLSSLLGNGSTNIPKDEFNEEVDFLGASLNISSQSAFASSLSKYTERIMELLADAAINPIFSEEELEKEREKLITGLKSQEKDPSAVSSRVNSALGYGVEHPFGEYLTEESVNSVTLADVQKFYRDYFVPANAYLVIVGDIKFKDARKLVKKYFTPWTKAAPPVESFAMPKAVQYNQTNFVDMPAAVQSVITVQGLMELKRNDPDYLAARLANKILGGGANARLFKNLREDKGYTYGSYSNISSNNLV
jgi:predicted Zn-dependent peptidase